MAQAVWQDPGSAFCKSKLHVFNPKRAPSLKTTTKADIIMGYDEPNNPRVEMCCGHPFCAETIFQLAKVCFEGSPTRYKIRCPIKGCHKEWAYKDVKLAGAFTPYENGCFTRWITKRSQKATTRECPHCQRICSPPRAMNEAMVICPCSKKFCWQCGKAWKGVGRQLCQNTGCSVMDLQKLLINCPKTTTTSIDTADCPKLRACPNCLTLIEHKTACKHMKCKFCEKEFCFRCLGIKSGKWPCGQYWDACTVAPRQILK